MYVSICLSTRLTEACQLGPLRRIPIIISRHTFQIYVHPSHMYSMTIAHPELRVLPIMPYICEGAATGGAGMLMLHVYLASNYWRRIPSLMSSR